MPTYATAPAAASEVEAPSGAAEFHASGGSSLRSRRAPSRRARRDVAGSAMILFSAFAATLDADFAAFEAKHGRSTPRRGRARVPPRRVRRERRRSVAHDAVSSAPYTLALNHWADRTAAELGQRPRPEPGAPASLLQAAEGRRCRSGCGAAARAGGGGSACGSRPAPTATSASARAPTPSRRCRRCGACCRRTRRRPPPSTGATRAWSRGRATRASAARATRS